ncbi:ABC transporter permease [Leifsonia sp. NPDC058248]|uniref:ABC transporter permease n=1 Tax=Leifsonia sp. NPDC058248 TaxID=3346402 RepID=UPI0036DD644D
MRMHGLRAAVWVEGRKLLTARVPIVTAILLVAGVAAICLSTTFAAASGSPDFAAKLGPLVAEGGWPGYLSAALQVTAAGSAGACGILLSWSFGREFSEGTVSGLFALPVSRPAIAASKLLVYLLWSILAAAAVTAVLVAAGLVAGLGAPTASDIGVVGRLPLLIVLTACMAIPAAWISSLTRGLLGGIAVTIGLVISAQVLVFAGSGPWYPPAAPALWALQPTATNGIATVIGLLLPAAATTLTVFAWGRLQLDR